MLSGTITSNFKITMQKTIKEILGSVRFWMVTISALFAVLSYYGVVPEEVRNIVIGWLGTVTGIGTLDKVATTLAPKDK